MNLHIITRCKKTSDLKKIKDSIFNDNASLIKNLNPSFQSDFGKLSPNIYLKSSIILYKLSVSKYD